MEDFEKIEYEQCLSLLKYYDEKHLSLVKFAAGLTSAIPVVFLALYRLDGQEPSGYWTFVAFASLVTALSLLVVYAALIQNRLNFVFPARQVNAIRNAQFQSFNAQSFENQMYTATGKEFNAFRWRSGHTFMNAFVSLQISVFVGLAFFSLYKDELTISTLVDRSIGVALVTTAAIFALSSIYLYVESNRLAKEYFGRKKNKIK